MKQRITKEDLAGLTDQQKQKLRELWQPGYYDVVFTDKQIQAVIFPDKSGNLIDIDLETRARYRKDDVLPLLSIGQMIEILEQIDPCFNITKRTDIGSIWGYEIQLRRLNYCIWTEGELADALWEAVKKVLI